MFQKDKVLCEIKSDYQVYQVVDTVFEGRAARILFSGNRAAAFSGIPLDGEHELLFDYIQRFFELIAHTRPKKVLMLGGGVYTLPVALIHALPDISLDVVEIDPAMDELAVNYFGYQPNERINIIHQDGVDFLQNADANYDAVIVDAFTKLEIPESLASGEVPQFIFDILTDNGLVAMNIISSARGRQSNSLKDFYYMYDKVFKKTEIYPADTAVSAWLPQNFLIVAQKGICKESLGLRFGNVEPPQSE